MELNGSMLIVEDACCSIALIYDDSWIPKKTYRFFSGDFFHDNVACISFYYFFLLFVQSFLFRFEK